jgi:hypothetical protein
MELICRGIHYAIAGTFASSMNYEMVAQTTPAHAQVATEERALERRVCLPAGPLILRVAQVTQL